MNILVIGSGGREHALVWKLRQSPNVKTVFCAPGNAGIEQCAVCVPLKPSDIKGLLKFAKEKKIDLTVVGSEQPLVEGIVDAFEERGFKIFGPSKAAAQLEGSKVFSKNFMLRHHIPTAHYRSFAATAIDEAKKYINTIEPPMVVKADGLAAGKGVLICKSRQEAALALDEIVLQKAFGSAGNHIVVEEFLNGEEASLFVLTDGERFATLASAQDHKRILDGDLGKNTGGMGAYAPAPIVTYELLQRVLHEVVQPTLDGMKQEGMPYRGCLYIGLMITRDGPQVLEYNCRFGDPETQVVVPLIDGDLAEIFLSISERRLDSSKVKLHSASAVCVVMASHGYPDKYQTGKQIFGLENIKAEDGVVVFHAGTKKEGSAIVTSGGRVLGVTAIGFNNELEQTIQNAYRTVEKITFDGAYYRSDIGKKALTHVHAK
ncbi:MAG: phosphoribosylamine--glycine ligase [Ignavibacteriales bacterium]|nr:phosphoribosylamine--glycine ligase [Ignavibacteriales bacterium]